MSTLIGRKNYARLVQKLKEKERSSMALFPVSNLGNLDRLNYPGNRFQVI
ncbi:MAG: hypothetical protein SVZ03_12305 [Spirochaetota bacterium]|nr:hypothetical protein [Spirochaetota bacterium]